MLFEKRTGSSVKLGLTPLIDMVFLLVVFFMLTSTFTQHEGMTIHFFDHATTLPSAQASETTLLSVTAEMGGNITLNGHTYRPRVFLKKLTALMAYHDNYHIVVEAAKEATVQHIVTTLDLIQLSGASQVVVRQTGTPLVP